MLHNDTTNPKHFLKTDDIPNAIMVIPELTDRNAYNAQLIVLVAVVAALRCFRVHGELRSKRNYARARSENGRCPHILLYIGILDWFNL